MFGVQLDRIYVSIGLWDIWNRGDIWMAGQDLSEEKRTSLSRSYSFQLKELVSFIR